MVEFVADGEVGPGMTPLEAAWVSRRRGDTAAMVEEQPADIVGRLIRASVRAREGALDEEDAAALEEAGLHTEVAFIRLESAIANKETSSLLSLLDRALDRLAKDPWLHTTFTSSVMHGLTAFDYASAPELPAQLAERFAEEPFAAMHSEASRLETAEKLLRRRAAGPMPSSCLRIFTPVEPHPVWSSSWLNQRLDCYRAFAPERVPAAEEDINALIDHSSLPLAALLTRE